jgi:hypothetical protein
VVVVGARGADRPAVHGVFEDDDGGVTVSVDGQFAGAVQNDRVSVAAVKLGDGSRPSTRRGYPGTEMTYSKTVSSARVSKKSAPSTRPLSPSAMIAKNGASAS